MMIIKRYKTFAVPIVVLAVLTIVISFWSGDVSILAGIVQLACVVALLCLVYKLVASLTPAPTEAGTETDEAAVRELAQDYQDILRVYLEVSYG
ncbi:hypothetical protein [Allohahella marinimesophila]